MSVLLYQEVFIPFVIEGVGNFQENNRFDLLHTKDEALAVMHVPRLFQEMFFVVPSGGLDEFNLFQGINNQLECVFHIVVQTYGVTNQSFAHAHLLLDFLRNFR